MKTSIKVLAVALGMTVAAGAMAEGSTIKNSVISNKAAVIGSKNTAIAAGVLNKAEANQGSIKLKNSTVKNSVISNKAAVIGSKNTAIAAGVLNKAKANQGSIDIE